MHYLKASKSKVALFDAGEEMVSDTWVYHKREYRCRNNCDKANFTFEIQGHNLSGIFLKIISTDNLYQDIF